MASSLASFLNWFTRTNRKSFPYPTKQLEDSATKILQIPNELPQESNNSQDKVAPSYVADLFGSFSTILDPPHQPIDNYKSETAFLEPREKDIPVNTQPIPPLELLKTEPLKPEPFESPASGMRSQQVCEEQAKVLQLKRKYSYDSLHLASVPSKKKTIAWKHSKFVPKIKCCPEKPVVKHTKIFEDFQQTPIEIEILEETDVFAFDGDFPEFRSPVEESTLDNDAPTTSHQVEVAQRDVTKALKECVRRFRSIQVTEGYLSAIGRLPIVKERLFEYCLGNNKEE